jgi:hypothetical protein
MTWFWPDIFMDANWWRSNIVTVCFLEPFSTLTAL